jgi:tetratricopeptide (TPR) repeat protein
LFHTNQLPEMLEAAKRAVALDPNAAYAYFAMGQAEAPIGRGEQSIAHIKQAFALSPRDPLVGVWHMDLGVSEVFCGRLDAAIAEFKRAIESGFRTFVPYALLAGAQAAKGNDAEAKLALAESRRLLPHLTINWFAQHVAQPPTNSRRRLAQSRVAGGIGVSVLKLQLVEQRLSLFQIAHVETFSEPAVDRSEQVASLIPLALIAPEPRHAHRGAQFLKFRALPTRNREGQIIVLLGSGVIAAGQKQITSHTVYGRLGRPVVSSVHDLHSLRSVVQALGMLPELEVERGYPREYGRST